MPQMNSFEPDGERKKLGLMSPIPVAWSMPGASGGWLMMGTMVRVMRFQSSVSLIGITGWMFRIQTLRFSGPVLKLKLFWNGTLIRSATGFCVFLARSVSLSSFPPAGAATCSARSPFARSTAVASETAVITRLVVVAGTPGAWQRGG